jgi:hypothetical protein
VCIGVWWAGTRHKDFLLPPAEGELAAIRERVEASMPEPDRPRDAISVPIGARRGIEEVLVEQAKPEMELGDLRSLPGLSAYSEVAQKGPDYMAQLASALEAEGELQRALLAWERLMDQSGASPERVEQAAQAVQRLRPALQDWNIDPDQAIPVILHGETAASQADELEAALAEVAHILERASSGILRATSEVVSNVRDPEAQGPSPVAIRLIGGTESSAVSTEVRSFRIESPELLVEQVGASVFLLMRNYLARSAELISPEPLKPGESAAEALEYRITRLAWQEFGLALNELGRSGD